MVEEGPSIPLQIRSATVDDLSAIRRIYNEGIDDRIATLDEAAKDAAEIADWWKQHGARYVVLVAEDHARNVLGWASINPYSHRCAYSAVGELSVYVTRAARGTGVGSSLLDELEQRAKRSAFHKIVLFMLTFNTYGQGLYRKFGYREVGVFREQGRLDGKFVDVLAMEKILWPKSDG